MSIYIYYIQHPKSLSMMVPAKTLIRDSASEELLVRQKNSASVSEMNQPLLQVLLSLLFFSATTFIFPHLQHRQQKPKATGPTSQTRGGSTKNGSGKLQNSGIDRPKVVEYGGQVFTSKIYPNIPNLERKCMNVIRLKESISSAMPSQSFCLFALTPSPPVQSSSCCFSCPQLI